MKTQSRPFQATITQAMKNDLEAFAKEDGMQRGYFFSTSGKLCCERVSATSQANWLFKTKAGQPKPVGNAHVNQVAGHCD